VPTAAAPPADVSAGPARGLVLPNGFVPPAAGGSRKNPNMTDHGGKIMPTAMTKAIFWGTS